LLFNIVEGYHKYILISRRTNTRNYYIWRNENWSIRSVFEWTSKHVWAFYLNRKVCLNNWKMFKMIVHLIVVYNSVPFLSTWGTSIGVHVWMFVLKNRFCDYSLQVRPTLCFFLLPCCIRGNALKWLAIYFFISVYFLYRIPNSYHIIYLFYQKKNTKYCLQIFDLLRGTLILSEQKLKFTSTFTHIFKNNT
jgi:hypothetical protein